MKLINILSHNLLPEQITELTEMGYDTITHLREINPDLAGKVSNCPGDRATLRGMAYDVAALAIPDKDGDVADLLVPGGSPAFMALLVRETDWRAEEKEERAPKLLFAHSQRESVEKTKEDGTVEKMSVFRHRHFIQV